MDESLENECEYITTHCKTLTGGKFLEQTCKTPDYKTCRTYKHLKDCEEYEQMIYTQYRVSQILGVLEHQKELPPEERQIPLDVAERQIKEVLKYHPGIESGEDNPTPLPKPKKKNIKPCDFFS